MVIRPRSRIYVKAENKAEIINYKMVPKRFIVFNAIIFFSGFLHVNGQNSRQYFKVEAGYLLGIGNINYGDRVSFENQSEAFRLRASYGFFINPKTSIGLGVGLDGYHNPQHNTLPVFLEARRFVNSDENSLYAFVNLGASVGISQSFDYGLHFSPGVGYVIKKRNMRILPSIGVNIQGIARGKAIVIDVQNNQVETIISRIYLKSVSFTIGIEF